MPDDKRPPKPGFTRDDRDRHPHKTPPKVIADQLARSGVIDPVVPAKADEAPESWDSSSAPTTAVMPKPPVTETVIDAINRRTQETKNTIASTLYGVAALRTETRADNQHLTARVDALVTELANTRAELAGSIGQNEAIIKLIEGQNEARAARERENLEARTRSGMMKLAGFTAETEVKKADQLAAIEVAKAARLLTLGDVADAKKTKRQAFLQLLGACTGTAVITALITFLSGHC